MPGIQAGPSDFRKLADVKSANSGITEDTVMKMLKTVSSDPDKDRNPFDYGLIDKLLNPEKLPGWRKPSVFDETPSKRTKKQSY